MRRDPNALLWDVLNAARKVETFVRGHTLGEFQTNALLQSAVERQLEIIGEALNQLSRHAPDVAQQIPDLGRIVGLRNVLIHGYAVVDQELIWRAVQENLPDLTTAVERFLEPPSSP